MYLLACGAEREPQARETSFDAAEQPSAISASCELPADCLPITSLVEVGVCCSQTLRCGFDLSPLAAVASMYPELMGSFDVEPDKPCWPRAKFFVELPRSAATRIPVEGGADILVTPDCQGRAFTTTPLPGCCLPGGSCGYATHLARHTFNELSVNTAEEAFTHAQCLTASDLNAQLRANDLAAWAYLPPASGRCDFAALDAALR
jgi:hypothetical protein